MQFIRALLPKDASIPRAPTDLDTRTTTHPHTRTYVGTVLEPVELVPQLDLVPALLHTDVHPAKEQPHKQAARLRLHALDNRQLVVEKGGGKLAIRRRHISGCVVCERASHVAK